MIDGSDILEIERQLCACVEDLRRRTSAYATSLQIREFISDNKKNLLARYVVPRLKAGDSAAAAEHHARANPEYQAELDTMGEQYQRAESHVASWRAAMARFEATRSLLSSARAQIPAAMKGAEG